MNELSSLHDNKEIVSLRNIVIWKMDLKQKDWSYDTYGRQLGWQEVVIRNPVEHWRGWLPWVRLCVLEPEEDVGHWCIRGKVSYKNWKGMDDIQEWTLELCSVQEIFFWLMIRRLSWCLLRWARFNIVVVKLPSWYCVIMEIAELLWLLRLWRQCYYRFVR